MPLPILDNSPQFEVWNSIASGIDAKTIDDRVELNITYEVIGKSETDVHIRVKSINVIEAQKRIT